MTSNSGILEDYTDDFITSGISGMAAHLRRPDIDPDTETLQKKTYLYHGT